MMKYGLQKLFNQYRIQYQLGGTAVLYTWYWSTS